LIVPLANTKTLREYIEGYTEAGVYSLIPLKHGTKNKPLIDWKPYQKRLPTPSEIASWFFSSGELRNVAAILGQASRLIAIDIDGDAAKQRVERKLAKLGYCNNLRVSILDTMMTLTGSGGFHLVFRVNPWLFEEYDLRTKTLWYDANSEHCEIKFLGEGSIVILSPSLHPNGVGRYLWNGKAPIELSEEALKQLFNAFSDRYLPTTLDEHTSTTTATTTTAATTISSPLSGQKIERLLAVLKPRYTKGRRHRITLGYSGFLRKEGYSLKAVEEFCVIVCQTFNDEELESRLHDVKDTFAKPMSTGREIAGWSMLNDIS
jgi:hypothetical protein